VVTFADAVPALVVFVTARSDGSYPNVVVVSDPATRFCSLVTRSNPS
jgi:hypothetical protein